MIMLSLKWTVWWMAIIQWFTIHVFIWPGLGYIYLCNTERTFEEPLGMDGGVCNQYILFSTLLDPLYFLVLFWNFFLLVKSTGCKKASTMELVLLLFCGKGFSLVLKRQFLNLFGLFCLTLYSNDSISCVKSRLYIGQFTLTSLMKSM